MQTNLSGNGGSILIFTFSNIISYIHSFGPVNIMHFQLKRFLFGFLNPSKFVIDTRKAFRTFFLNVGMILFRKENRYQLLDKLDGATNTTFLSSLASHSKSYFGRILYFKRAIFDYFFHCDLQLSACVELNLK